MKNEMEKKIYRVDSRLVVVETPAAAPSAELVVIATSHLPV